MVTARARTHIRHFLKDQRREDSLALGRNLLTALMAQDTRLNAIDQEAMQSALNALGKTDVESWLLMSHSVTRYRILSWRTLRAPAMTPLSAVRQRHGYSRYGRRWRHLRKMLLPITWRPIQGYLGQEKGLMVHRDNCRNLVELREQPDRLISLHWDDIVERTYPVGLRVQVENRRGMIAVLATRLSAIGLNIERIATQNKDVEFTLLIWSCR